MKMPDDIDPVNKPDLKHDTMEFNAATEGEDVLDTDNESQQDVEDESITADELEALEEDAPDDQAAALITAETDSAADEDNFLAEPDAIDEESYEGDDDLEKDQPQYP